MTATNQSWLLTNASVLDPVSGEITPDRRILVTDGLISEVGGHEVGYTGADTIDLAGRIVLPGLIDAHVHVTAASADLSALPHMSPSFTALHAAKELNAMLHRGFTTVRDCGGADFGLAQALTTGLIIDEQTAALFPEHGVVLVPTLITYQALAKGGRAAGLSETTHRKVFDVLDAGLSGLETAYRAGVDIALGSDLLGDLQVHQSEELLLRAEVQQPLDVIRSATTVGARLLGEEGRLGVIAVGGFADLLVVEGDPLEDISVLTQPTKLALVMRAGVPVKAP